MGHVCIPLPLHQKSSLLFKEIRFLLTWSALSITPKLSSIFYLLAFLTPFYSFLVERKKITLLILYPLTDSFTSQLPALSRPEITIKFSSFGPIPTRQAISSTTETVLVNVTKDLLIGKSRKRFSVLTLFDLSEAFDT